MGLVPVFNCTVEVGGRVFAGEPAKSKKQAEKNAAMVAWSSIKQCCEGSSTSGKSDSISSSAVMSSALMPHQRDVRVQTHVGRSRIRMVNVREQSCLNRDSVASSPARERSDESRRFLFNQQQNSTSRDVSQSANSHKRSHLEGSLASFPSTERSYASQRFLFNQQPHSTGSDLARSGGGSTHQRSHSLSGIAFDSSILLPHETSGSSGGSGGGGYLGSPLPRQHQPRASRLSLQSSSDRIELRRPLVEEFQREGDSDWFNALMGTTSTTNLLSQQYQQQQHQQQSPNVLLPSRRAQSERFELKPSLFDELYQRDEEEWWFRGERLHPDRERVAQYEGGDKGKYVYGRKGSFDPVSHISDYTNEPATVVGSPYSRRWREANSSYIGYGSNAGQVGSSASHYSELSNVPTVYGAFSTTSQVGDSYSCFNVKATGTSFFSNGAFGDTFSGHCNPASCGHDTAETIPSSSSRWLHSSQWLNSPSSNTSSTVAHTLGLRTSSMPPPVRVRQTVAVCSAPPTRSMAFENDAVANMSSPSLHYTDCTSIDVEASTSDILKQLRLE